VLLEEQCLDSRLHDRKSFKSGVTELDEYLQRYAVKQSQRGVSRVWVLVDSDAPSAIFGYYSLSAAQVNIAQLSAQEQRKLPKYPVPCFRLGRLAVQQRLQGQGIGRYLLGCALERCLQARKSVAAYALLVEAKNVNAAGFYQHYGFIPCNDNPNTLYFPLNPNLLQPLI